MNGRVCRMKMLPFSIGLRLSEPDEDDQPWILETVFRDVKKPDQRFFNVGKETDSKTMAPFSTLMFTLKRHDGKNYFHG